MQEDFLHFLWQWRRFEARDLATTDGEALEILQPGQPNSDGGPDFTDARIRIGGTLWAGNVEMHLLASDWTAHRHDGDPAYRNVILHVVLDEDQRLLRPATPTGERLPCLELRRRIPPKLLENYRRLQHEQAWAPCAGFFKEVPDVVRLNWLDRLLAERLEHKSGAFARDLADTENHWEEVFYRALARNFGLKINAAPFESLARSLPFSVLQKHRTNLLQLEALLFGQAGMLDEIFEEEHPRALAKEYRYLRQKFDLQPIAPGQWKFLRLRPAGFPTLRLAQFAGLWHRTEHLFSKMLAAGTPRELEHLFDAPAGEYWETHYRFGKPSAARKKTPGKDFLQLLLVNTVAPFLFQYGKTKGQPAFRDKALALLEALPAEANSVLEGWAELGFKAANAGQGQALLELKTKFCDAKRCLDCAVGQAILR